MPRLLSPAMIQDKNQLASTHVWTMLFSLEIPGAPAPYRLAHADHDIVFHGLTFIKFPVTMDSFEDANSMALVRLRITAGNVDQGFQALLETYWRQDNPWIATLWQIDVAQPDETPYAAGDLFTVMQVATDLRSAVVDVQAEGLTLSGTVPKRRYTQFGGFPGIPKRLL